MLDDKTKSRINHAAILRDTGTILVEAQLDYMGSVIARPVCDEYAKAYAKHVKEFTGNYELTAYFQEGMGAQQFIEYWVPEDKCEELNSGWSIEFVADPWDVGHWYGYDAYNVELDSVVEGNE